MPDRIVAKLDPSEYSYKGLAMARRWSEMFNFILDELELVVSPHSITEAELTKLQNIYNDTAKLVKDIASRDKDPHLGMAHAPPGSGTAHEPTVSVD